MTTPTNRDRKKKLWDATDTRVDYGISGEEVSARQIQRLPSLASTFYPDLEESFSWKPTLVELFAGTRDDASPLSLIRDNTLVRHIYSYVASKWARHVTLTIPASCVGSDNEGTFVFPNGRIDEDWAEEGAYDGIQYKEVVPSSETPAYVAFVHCGFVKFPEPANRNINMMPFVFGNKASLPEELQCYYDMIEKCPYDKEESGKVGYLTVHESYVNAEKAQRREGLHIESPGVFSDDPNASVFEPGNEHTWGEGTMFNEPDRFEGGIYMASSVDNTSEVWDALVDRTIKGIVDHHGGCEHLRRFIGQGTKLEANQLIWMTDRTPHEALPQETSGYRQFFRVVTSRVSHWYANHSTPNPLVALPDNVTVIHGDKFANDHKRKHEVVE